MNDRLSLDEEPKRLDPAMRVGPWHRSSRDAHPTIAEPAGNPHAQLRAFIRSATVELLGMIPATAREPAALLLDRFVSQLELNAVRIMEQSAADRMRAWPFAFAALSRRFIEKETVVCSTVDSSGGVVLWPWQTGHFEIMLPVLKALNERDSSRPIWIIAHHPALDLSKAGGHAIIRPSVRRQWRRSPGAWRSLASSLVRRAWTIPAYHPANGSPVRFSRVLRYAFSRYLSLFEQTLQMCEQVWHRMRPGYVMVGYDFTLVGRTVVNYFQDKGVTTGCPMHGTLNPNRPAELFRADRLYLYGENHRRALIARGVPASRLLVTGSTQLDDVWPKVRRWAQRPNAAILGLAGGKPLALVALSGPGHSVTREHHRLIIAEIARGAAAFPRVHFVFKLHQKDNRGYYADVLSRYANTSLVSFRNAISEDIYEWIFHSTLLITGASSSAFEAMVLGKPVITLDLLHELPRFDFIERGVTLHVGERGRLVYFLESILGNGDEYRSVAEKANAYIANCFHNVSGASAADAMAADIVSVLEHRASICGREP